jgi:hypothetical protein
VTPDYLEVLYEFLDKHIIIGVIVDANIGIVVAGVLAISKRSNYAEIFQPAQYPMGEAVINDAAPQAEAYICILTTTN